MAKAIKIIHSHFDGAWICWTKVPRDVREQWWKEFKVYIHVLF